MRINIVQIIFSVLILLLCSSIASAQLIKNSSPGLYDNYLLDTSAPDDYSGGYYVSSETDSIKWQSPTVAFFKSMVFPGWGQLGNRQYIKAGIIIGAETVLLGTMVHYFKTTSDAKKAFDLASLGGDDVLINQTYIAYDRAKENRNLFTWFSGTIIFLSMFDAYVDAHLARFPKYDDKISFKIKSNEFDEIQVAMALNF